MTVVLEQEPISTERLKERLVDKIRLHLAKPQEIATRRDWWRVTCKVVHEQVVEAMLETQQRHYRENARRVYYLSMEYLMGRLLANNLENARLYDAMRDALAELGQELEDLIEEE